MSPGNGVVPPSFFRSLRRPGLLGTLLVVATLALAGALAHQAVRAAASHRAAVETALEHHATTAAWRFAREARGWVGYGMNNAGEALQREADRSATLPEPAVMRRLFAQKYCDCMTAAFARTLVRVVTGGNAVLDLEGEPLSERARDDLRDRMLTLVADTTPLQAARTWWILPPGVPRLNRGSDVVLLWRVSGPARRGRAVYGMIVERAQIERPLIGALSSAQLFPPTVAAADTGATLVRMEVAGPNGVPLFTAGPETHRFLGTDTLGTEYGNLIAMAAINPEAAQVFVAGGVPESRLPMILALLTLALAMGGTAAVLLRREQRLARLREDFVSGVSHELRTPLTHIRALSELLESDGFRSPAERSRAVGIIHRESLRLTNLVDNVLAFTRVRRTPTLSLPASRVFLGDVLREVADSFAPLLESQGSRLDLVVEDDVAVAVDRDTVSRVLRNLIDNAVKYGPASQTIRVTLARTQTGARVIVDDQGPGIPPAERGHIWQPYYRLDRDRNAPAGGSGLGLSVVSDLVRAVGGSVVVGDAPERGARFVVDLPGAP